MWVKKKKIRLPLAWKTRYFLFIKLCWSKNLAFDFFFRERGRDPRRIHEWGSSGFGGFHQKFGFWKEKKNSSPVIFSSSYPFVLVIKCVSKCLLVIFLFNLVKRIGIKDFTVQWCHLPRLQCFLFIVVNFLMFVYFFKILFYLWRLIEVISLG